MSAQRSPSVPNFKPNQLLNGWEVELPLKSPKSEVGNQELDPPYSVWSSRIPSPVLCLLSKMLYKTKEVSDDGRKIPKLHVIDNNVFTELIGIGAAEKKVQKNGADPAISLKTHVEKMSTFLLSKMFMKTQDLHAAFQDVHEKKGG